MNKLLRVLIVEDLQDDALLVVGQLKQAGYEVSFERVETEKAMAAALSKEKWDIIIADYSLPHFSGLAALKFIQENGIDLPFIVMSGTVGEDVAVEIIKAGAQDYLMKNNLKRLAIAVEREMREAANRREHKRIEKELHKEKQFIENFINTVQVIILTLDKRGHIVNFNPYMEKISGYRLEEVKGKDWFETFLPESIRSRTRELFLKAISDIQTKGNVNPVIAKDGRKIEVEWYDKTIKDNDGNIEGLLSIGIDVTERKKIEEQEHQHMHELEVFHKVTMGREGRIMELKDEVNRLKQELEKLKPKE